MSSARLRQSFAALMGALAATAVLHARLQDIPQPTFRTDASYVRLDVFPTLNGSPVSDLRVEDFEVLEDGRPQTVTAFEHVLIRGSVPQELRAEPNTVAQSNALLQNGHARAFVIFLDTNHVGIEGSYNIRQPLINALNRMIGPDDLVGVMTPEMSAADVTFARRTTTIEGFLTKHWTWGQRDQLNSKDPVEEGYKACFPGVPNICVDDRGIADEMIARRREKMSLDAVDDLIRHLATEREERTAVLAISEGWLLYRPNQSLARNVDHCQGPPVPTIGVDPRTGRITADRTDPLTGTNPSRCEADRMMLAQLDDSNRFQTMLDRANRANVSFYPIDPRGLVAFDTPIAAPRTGLPLDGTPTYTPPAQDAAMLRARLGTLRDLATATDGTAIINTNDLEGGLRRVTTDLSSYYLLGYYSNGKLDGKFHSIRVRVRRPGVQVRARRGYLALTAAEAVVPSVTNPQSTANRLSATVTTSALTTALAALASVTRDARIHLSYAVNRATDRPGTGPAEAAVWAIGELGSGDEWRQGADVDLNLTAADGHIVSTQRERMAAGLRGFRSTFRAGMELAPGEYTIRARVIPLAPNAEPLTEMLRVVVPGSGLSGMLITRRGLSTGNREVPAADLRFRRAEQLRVDVPSLVASTATARLLDSRGNPIAIPITPSLRNDADGTRWISASLQLAPLAPSDYVIEISAERAGPDSAKTFFAFRVVP